MPKQFLHSDQINALHDQVRSKGMSQVMEAEIFDFGRATGLFEGVVDGNLADGIAPRPHEEKVTVTIRAGPFQRAPCRFVNRNRLSPQGFALDDRDRSSLEVYVFPFEL